MALHGHDVNVGKGEESKEKEAACAASQQLDRGSCQLARHRSLRDAQLQLADRSPAAPSSCARSEGVSE